MSEGTAAGGRKKYRRTKRVLEHANPLFDRWLKEWQQEAERKNSKMKYNFQKARKSLSLYPLALYTGRDCKLLANFGNKICQMLDQRLAQFEEEQGPVDWNQVHKVRQETPRKRGKKKITTTATTFTTTTTTTATTARQSCSPRPQEFDSKLSGEEKRGRKRKSGEYLPVVRSGAYALLLALHRASQVPHYLGYMKKEELMRDAQPLCDASMTQGGGEGSRYTAWSSMTTLVKKGLVSRQSHPPRFSITQAGEALASKIKSAESTIDQTDWLGPRTAPQVNSVRSSTLVGQTSTTKPIHTLSDSSDDGGDDYDACMVDLSCPRHTSLTEAPPSPLTPALEENAGERSTASPPHSPALPMASPEVKAGSLDTTHGGLSFSYVTPLGLETTLKDKAAVSVEDDGFLGFLIKCHCSALLQANLSHRPDHSRTAPPGFTYTYLSNECAPDQCPSSGRMSGERQVAVPQSSLTKLKQTNLRGPVSDTQTMAVPTHNKKKTKPLTKPTVRRPLTALPAAPSSTQFTLLPGRYEIVLCIDNAETSGKLAGMKHNNKDLILSELVRQGVKHHVRKLHVGDFLWVCRETLPSPTAGSGCPVEEARELVLPVVVERKRFDDLAASIRDGRFKEQKFRLKQCGLTRPVYLVEQQASITQSLPELTCLQAIVNTQITDGFTVKVTKDQRESAAYLTIMTRWLQSRYQGRIVSSAQLHDLGDSQTNIPSETETSLPSFAEFNAASAKNQKLSVQEMFAKHLLQLHGLSVDKARAVVDKYGTPSLLMAAYSGAASMDEAEKLLAGLKWGRAGRSLGPALSASIAKLYTRLHLQ